MHDRLTMAFSLDASRAEALFAQLLEAPLKVREGVVHFLEALPEAAWASSVDLDVCSTSRATQHRIVLEPSQALLDLVAALGAGDLDLSVVQRSSHGRPSPKVV